MKLLPICSALVLLLQVSCGQKQSTIENDEQGVVVFEADDYAEPTFDLSCSYTPMGDSDLFAGVFEAGFDLATYVEPSTSHPRCFRILQNMRTKQQRYLILFF